MGRGARINGLNQLESILPNLDMVSVALDLNPDEVISTLSMDSDYSSIIEIESITLIDAFDKTGNRYPTRFARIPRTRNIT